ncbi:hypothetical protein [Sphingomonas mesophila]|uniref:hypothetical protein n=1 Tax=Sphingomonas mesophila TaxID=2303576 RepID=UPI0013C322DA|nr:hypothetical protein [Sphingomonas mesophila]
MKRKQVDEALLSIWREHSDRLSSSFAATQEFGLSKNEDAKNFLRREIYALGLAIRRSPPEWNVAELIASSRAHQTTRFEVLENQLFHALFMGVYDEDALIKRQERWLMAKELEYALRHSVPPEFLCGFLYQSGGRKNLLKKLEANYREPWFQHGPSGQRHTGPSGY